MILWTRSLSSGSLGCSWRTSHRHSLLPPLCESPPASLGGCYEGDTDKAEDRRDPHLRRVAEAQLAPVDHRRERRADDNSQRAEEGDGCGGRVVEGDGLRDVAKRREAAAKHRAEEANASRGRALELLLPLSPSALGRLPCSVAAFGPAATADDVPPITARLEFPAANPLGCDAARYGDDEEEDTRGRGRKDDSSSRRGADKAAGVYPGSGELAK